MSGKTFGLFRKTAWVIFILSILINLFHWFLQYRNELFRNNLPFDLKESRASDFTDSTYFQVLKNKVILQIDSIRIDPKLVYTKSGNNWLVNLSEYISVSSPSPGLNRDRKEQIRIRLNKKTSVNVHYFDPLSEETDEVSVKLERNLDRLAFFNLVCSILFVGIIYFNILLLLKYSISPDNILIIFFLIILALPGALPLGDLYRIINYYAASLLGILFYHYIVTRIRSGTRIRILYLISLGLATLISLVYLITGSNLETVVFLWSVLWIMIGYIRLWKEYKKSGSIEQKRLLGAFKGIFLVIISLFMIVIMTSVLAILSQGYIRYGIYNIRMILIAVLLILSAVAFLIGVLWFFGSFTWSLLTGTVLDVKIRSTIIYTLIGIFFVTFFGLVDYTLGEFLQKMFGNFIGSEFIAGIPATIGLLIFFNPIRTRVENLVDSRLNTSELDFLEKTDSFSEKLVGESIIEGFEEYICENLIHRLSIKKVALVSFDPALGYFKFNEIRGSDVIENSRVEDIHDYLQLDQVTRNYITNENEQEIASFSLIIPILYEESHKWYLALGRKKDGSVYTKNDEKALLKLTARMKLSLKFIITYDDIVNRKYIRTIEEKEKEIEKYKKALEELRGTGNGENQS